MNLKTTSILPILALMIVGISLSVVTAGILVSQQNIQTSGTIGSQTVTSINVGVFSDSSATVLCSDIEWGNLNPGGTTTKIIYIKNTGNASVTLSMTTGSWNPASAYSSLTLGWNREGATLQVNETIAATLTLAVSPDPGSLSSFSFNIIVSGTA